MTEARIIADVSGSIWKVHAKVGDTVAEGDEIIVIESMKMEIPVMAPAAGTIVSLAVKEGEQIKEGQVLVMLKT